MGISSPGIGSGIDVNAIVGKLMQVESAPLASYEKKTSAYQTKLAALGALTGAIGSFQSSLSPLSSLTGFQALTSTSTDTTVMVGTATSKARPGTYKIDVTQIAQAQTLASAGYLSTTAAIGLGNTTTLSFQLGTASGGSFGLTGTALGAGVLSGGITPGGLSINGTVIATDSGTKSAKLLVDAINAKSVTTGVTAKASTTATSATLFGAAGASTFGDVDTSGTGTYALSVGGVQIASQADGVAAGAGVSAASIDAILAGSNGVTNALAAANITFTGSAADGTLQFSNADGSNIAVTEAVTGTVTGGIGIGAGGANLGSTTTASASISLVSTNAAPITVAGSNPAAAGLVAGTGGAYQGGGFVQDGAQASGSVVIDSTNNSLQGIRDAINKANFGVTASIVSDGSATPNHLVLTSTQTGASSTMKITLSGSGGNPADPDLVSLLGYDPSGVQNMSQKSAAQSTLANVNGIPVTSNSTSINGAIEGVNLSIGSVGSANLIVARDNSSLTNSVSGFVKAYNDLNAMLKKTAGYDPETKVGGPLLGDSTAQSLQSQVRKQMSASITGLTGNLTSLSQIGIAFQKDGSLVLDNAKLGKAVTSNFADIASLFAAVGKSSDTLISFTSSTAATKAGDYAVNITALASQGSVKGGVAVPGSVTIDADTSWVVGLNDTDPTSPSNSDSVTIPAGTYTPAQLATLLQSAINGSSKFSTAGAAVTATIESDGTLKMVSNRYGSKSNILLSEGSGTTVASLFGGATPVKGVDVSGTIGGYTATGVGQTLTGEPGGPVDGLKLEVTGGATGARGVVGFSQGYAYQLNNLAATYLGSKGLIAARNTGINASIKDIAKQQTAFSDKLVDIEKRYRAQYSALDTMIASMNTTTSFLTQQLAAMAANN